MFQTVIAERLRTNRIPFSADLPEKLSVYLQMLTEWNEKMDLTAVLEPEEMIDRHFIDSLMLLKTDPGPFHALIDVGTGAGFPGMVLAMALPETRVTLLDAQQKRLNFLQAVADETGTDVTILHARAEDAARQKEYREQFDAAVARAVAPVDVLCEYLMPFLKTGGKAICWKGPSLDREMTNGEKAIRILGGETEAVRTCPIEGRDWDHRLLVVKKNRATDARFPRKPALIKSAPLGTGKT